MSYVRTYCVLYARVHEDTIRSRACKRTKTHHRIIAHHDVSFVSSLVTFAGRNPYNTC